MNDEAARQGRPDTHLITAQSIAPRVVIVLPLEGRPTVEEEAARESDSRRLEDWIKSRPELLQLVTDAVHLSARKAA